MNQFWLARIACFGVVLVFSVIVFGLSSYIISKTSIKFEGFTIFHSFIWAKLALTASILTLICLTPMLVIDFCLNAHTYKIMAEVIVLGFLAVLWLAAGADTSAFFNHDIPACRDFEIHFDGIHVPNVVATLCHSYKAVEAFSWVNWLILTVYFITLLVFAIRAGSRGNNVWNASVRNTDFFEKGNPDNAFPMTHQGITDNTPKPAQYNQDAILASP